MICWGTVAIGTQEICAHIHAYIVDNISKYTSAHNKSAHLKLWKNPCFSITIRQIGNEFNITIYFNIYIHK